MYLLSDVVLFSFFGVFLFSSPSSPTSSQACMTGQQLRRSVITEKKRQAGLKALRAFKNVVVGKTAGEDSVADAVEDAMNSLRLQEHVQYVRELVHEYLVEKMREHNVTEQS